MLSFISFILVCIGSLNWFSIGILQYDFVAGIFGSQSNIFSRLIYTLVGVASIVVVVNMIANKGKFVVSFKKATTEYKEYMEEKKDERREPSLNNAESARDNSIDSHTSNSCNCNSHSSDSHNSCNCNSRGSDSHNPNNHSQK